MYRNTIVYPIMIIHINSIEVSGIVLLNDGCNHVNSVPFGFHMSIDCDGNIWKKKRWKPCKCGDEGSMHRAKSKKLEFTPGFVICWIGILIYYESIGTDKSPLNFWVGMPCGIYAPWIHNVMTQDAFRYCRTFGHLSGVVTLNHRVTSGYDPLSKIRYVMKKIMDNLRLG